MTIAQKIFLSICAVLATIVFVGCAPTAAYVAARHIETGIATFVDTGADIWHQYSHAHLENCKDAAGDMQTFLQCSGAWEEDAVKIADRAIVVAREAVREYDASLNTADAVRIKDYSGAIMKVIAAIVEMVKTLQGIGVTISAPSNFATFGQVK